MINPRTGKGLSVIIVLALTIAGVLYFFMRSGNTVLPKPRGYFRIDLPAKEYTRYSSPCGASFDLPNYTQVRLFKDRDTPDSCWFNLAYPRLRATLHCTVLPINKDLSSLIRDAYGFAAKHEMKASALKRTPVVVPEHDVYGLVYTIEGMAASQVQFFLTDSTEHFFRGALYFDNKPNPDSIAPVLEFIQADIDRLIQSLVWE
jgi:gliding motility-associated lipoprotein GldD